MDELENDGVLGDTDLNDDEDELGDELDEEEVADDMMEDEE